MPAFCAIYYPSWNPPSQWLRAMLLFYDRVEVILPSGVDPNYSDANKSIIDQMPDAWHEIREDNYWHEVSSQSIERTKRAIDLICGVASDGGIGEHLVTIMPDGSICVDNHTFLHKSKLGLEMRSYLKHRGLSREVPSEVCEHAGYELVNSRAASLILSGIADHYASRGGQRVVTDETLAFCLHESNERDAYASSQTESYLASVILSLEIPRAIVKFSPERYRDLRERYTQIRMLFQKSVRELCMDYNVAVIHDEDDLKGRVREIAEEFSLEVARFRMSFFATKIRNWIPLGLRQVANVAKLSGSTGYRSAAEGVCVGLDVFNDTRAAPIARSGTHARRMLASLQSEILEPSRMERIWRKLNGDVVWS